MISTIDIIRGISEWIEANFGEPPISKDITEGFGRPSTYVDVGDITSGVETGMLHDSMTIEITRFSEFSYRGYLELLEYQKKFTEMLAKGFIPISEHFYIYPSTGDFELDREDMYLSLSFEIEDFQQMAEPDAEVMDTLLINEQE